MPGGLLVAFAVPGRVAAMVVVGLESQLVGGAVVLRGGQSKSRIRQLG